MKVFYTAIFLLSSLFLSADGAKRQLIIERATGEIRIDGVLDEPVWSAIPSTGSFTQHQPNPGAASTQRIEVRITYDDAAIYVAARLFEDPGLVAAQLFERDQHNDNVEADWFGIAFDTYRDGINGYGFLVTPAGVQMDLKFTVDSEDFAWDAVWDSEVSIDSLGWTAEMEIPYSALRFPDKAEQTWHLQIGRWRFQAREESFWNPVDPEVAGFFTQAGILRGLKDIEPPVRLSATPYLSYYVDNVYDKTTDPQSTWGQTFNGGMDLRYGVSEAFTLDMTLIPDFGQVRSDNEVLNLSPFEVHFDENRQFFTEGTELFNKANIFYSRRVGGTPLYAPEVESMIREGEVIVKNPQETQLYNATKLSGRTRSGTGLGLFNAIVGTRYAIVRDEAGTERRIQTNPLTNYNVMVFDQNMENNSFVSLINTNVWRSGHAYEANVTGTAFSINDKANTYAIRGSGALSQKYFGDSTDLGFRHHVEVAKQSGNLTGEISHYMESHTYDPNDFGFNSSNNVRTVSAFLEYNVFEPFGRWQRMRGGISFGLSYLYKFTGPEELRTRESLRRSTDFSVWWYGLTHNYLSLNGTFFAVPGRSYNYFESRVDGRVAHFPAMYRLTFEAGTDSRKRIQVNARFGITFRSERGKNQQEIRLEPQFRISDKLTLLYSGFASVSRNDAGYVTHYSPVDIVFGKRDITNVINLVQANLAFNARMHINFRLRHNWTRVRYNSFYALRPDGGEAPTNYSEDEDVNFNAFTIDAVYRWRFAPGSDIYLVWKNNITGVANRSDLNFWQNFDHLGELPQFNSFSVKVLYYLDYVKLRGG